MAKYRGYRITLNRNTTGSTYAVVGQVLEIGDIGSSRDQLDVSAHGDEWMDFLGGRQEGTEVSIRYAYDPSDSQQTQIKSDYDNSLNKLYQLIHPDYSAKVQFNTISLGWLVRPPQDGAVEAEVTLKIVNPGVTIV